MEEQMLEGSPLSKTIFAASQPASLPAHTASQASASSHTFKALPMLVQMLFHDYLCAISLSHYQAM